MEQELLLGLLPSNGDPISRAAVAVLLSEKLGRALDDSDVDSFIWAAGNQISWDHVNQQIKLTEFSRFPSEIEREADLEPWFERYLLRCASEVFFSYVPPSLSLVVQNTARTGPATGVFTKPDVCMASVALFHYSPCAHFDLFAFELKMQGGCSADSVMQAKSYGEFAHYCYVGVFLPDRSDMLDNLPTMRERAQAQGVGVIRITDPFRDDGYQILVGASRNTPHPGRIDKFVEDRFSDANKSALRKWVRL